MSFGRPELLALAPLAILVAVLGVTGQWRRGMRLLLWYGGPRTAERLAGRELERFPRLRVASATALCATLAVAAAEPKSLAQGGSDEPIDLVLALDVSLSMSADDVTPTRAQRATEVVARVVEALPSERIALNVFADWPYTLVPLTDDLSVVRFFADRLGPELVADRDQGTGLAAAITHARATLEARRRPEAKPVILILSDGESFAEEAVVLDSVAAAAADGVTVWTAGIGTRSGAPLIRPGSTGEPLVDEAGEPVVVRLDDGLLRRVAEAGGGRYVDASRDRGVNALIDGLGGGEREAALDQERAGLALWLALLALGLLFLEGSLDTAGRSRWIRLPSSFLLRIERWARGLRPAEARR